jgi:signal transduction histidine kinase
MEAEKQRALTQMVAGVAHEINTPLSIINTAVTIMARELAAPLEVTVQRAADIAEPLELMRLNVERAQQLVQNFKKITAGQFQEEKELFDVVEAIEETIGLCCRGNRRDHWAGERQFKARADPGQVS